MNGDLLYYKKQTGGYRLRTCTHISIYSMQWLYVKQGWGATLVTPIEDLQEPRKQNIHRDGHP